MNERVTCLLSTSNRFPHEQHLVEESVESFLRQTYKSCELLILNDAPGQVLKLDLPNVRIINLDTRFPTLTDKWITGAELCNTELICPWDDDDIHLPHRIEQCIDHIEDAEFWMPPNIFMWWDKQQKIELSAIMSFDIGIFKRSALLNMSNIITREPIMADTILCDAMLNKHHCTKARVLFNKQQTNPPKLEPFYIYRRETSRQHLSGNSSRYTSVGENIIPGIYEIKPHWNKDWTNLAKTAI